MRMTIVSIQIITPDSISNLTDLAKAPTISSSGALGLVCDTSANGWYPCHLTLLVQFPTFQRTIVQRRWEMSWLVSSLYILSFMGLAEYFLF